MLSPAEWIVLAVTLGLITALMVLNARSKHQAGQAAEPDVTVSEPETGEEIE